MEKKYRGNIQIQLVLLQGTTWVNSVPHKIYKTCCRTLETASYLSGDRVIWKAIAVTPHFSWRGNEVCIKENIRVGRELQAYDTTTLNKQLRDFASRPQRCATISSTLKLHRNEIVEIINSQVLHSYDSSANPLWSLGNKHKTNLDKVSINKAATDITFVSDDT